MPKSTFVPKGIPIGFQMAEKKREQTDKQTTDKRTNTYLYK